MELPNTLREENNMKKSESTNDKLDNIIQLLRMLVAIEFYRNNMSKGLIAKKIRVAKSKVVKILSGVKKS